MTTDGPGRLRLHASPFPWVRPRRELLLLVLVAATALTPDHIGSSQDWTRVCLSRAIVHARLTVDNCIGTTVDRSLYHGHLYSNKAPGLSLLAIPVSEAVRLRAPDTWSEIHDVRLWAVRVLTSGLLFLIAAFVVGRVSEGLAPGSGGLVLTTLALGTLLAPFAATSFDHDPAAAFTIVAFALVWSRRPLLAGLAAGTAFLVEYESGPTVLILGAYAAFLGARPLMRYAAGILPGVALLGAYDWAAFGAPWRNPLSYSNNVYHAAHQRGILGIDLPSLHSAERVLVGTGGLLVLTPVSLAAAAGLWLLWRGGHGAEALVCAAVTAAYLIAEFGYFTPYGGLSPGPRFLIPALPFAFLGLGPALKRWPVTTCSLAVASVIANTVVLLDWSYGHTQSYAQGIWGQLVRLPNDGKSTPLLNDLAKNIFQYVGVGLSRPLAALVVCACAAAAMIVALPRPAWPFAGRRAA